MNEKIDNKELREYPIGASNLGEAVSDFEASSNLGFGRPWSRWIREVKLPSEQTLIYAIEFKIREANVEIYGYKFKRLFRKPKVIPILEKERTSVKYNLTKKLLSEDLVKIDDMKFIY